MSATPQTAPPRSLEAPDARKARLVPDPHYTRFLSEMLNQKRRAGETLAARRNVVLEECAEFMVFNGNGRAALFKLSPSCFLAQPIETDQRELLLFARRQMSQRAIESEIGRKVQPNHDQGNGERDSSPISSLPHRHATAAVLPLLD